MHDLLGLGAVGLVGVEWLALGWLGGLRWPGPGEASATWALRLLGGAFLTALAMLVLALVGPGFGSPLAVLGLAAVGALGLRAARRGVDEAHRQRRDATCEHVGCGDAALGTRKRERIGWVVLGVALATMCARAFTLPEVGWDAYSHWGLKALAYAQAGTIVDTHTVHEYYPPLVPLLESFVYTQRGVVSIDLGKDVWALVGSAFVLGLAAHLRRLLVVRWLAPYVGLGVLFASTQVLEDFSTGQADLALTAFLTLGTLAAVAWLRDGQPAWLIQAGVFAAAAALTKYEGLPRVAVVAAAIAVDAVLARRPDAWRPIGWLIGAGLAATGLWLGFEATHGIAATGEHMAAVQPRALGSIVQALIAVFAGLRTGGAIVVVVLAWVVAGRRSFGSRTRVLALVVLGQAAATLLAFLVSDTAPEVEVRTAATRLFEQFMPLALVACAVWLEAQLIIGRGR